MSEQPGPADSAYVVVELPLSIEYARELFGRLGRALEQVKEIEDA